MPGAILTLNAGSSSVKYAMFDPAKGLTATARGEIEGLRDTPHFVARDGSGQVLAERHWPRGAALPFSSALDVLLDFATGHAGPAGIVAAGHRIVHGGATHIAPERVTPALIEALEKLTLLDPLHMPGNLAPLHALIAARPDLPQVVCFDTAFHHTIPAVAQRFALPRDITGAGVRRYGFHGLSYEHIAHRLKEVAPDLAAGRVVVAHLGSGASLCALQGGESIATTTGFSTLDGLVMATRCGRLDPGALIYLLRQGLTLDNVEDMLYRRSGLLGVSGISGDDRVLHASSDPRAKEALELFAYQVAVETGGLVSALGGLDGFVFTGGIGENSRDTRAAICERLAWLGFRLDPAANAANEMRIGTPESGIDIRVIPTDEEAMIAQHTLALLRL